MIVEENPYQGGWGATVASLVRTRSQMEATYDGSDPRRCNAKTRSTEDHRAKGVPCKNWAGFRTPHPGIGNCFLHGGSTTSHRKSAVSVEAKRRMVQLGTPIEGVTAPEALMGLLRASAGHVAFLQQSVAALDALASPEAEVLVRLYDTERDRLARISEACVRAGVAEHIIRMETAQAELTLRAIRDAARDAGLNATQVQALGAALHKRLAEHGGDPERADREAAQADARLADLRNKIARDEENRVAKLADRRARDLSGLTFPPEEMVPDAEPDAPAAA